MLNYNEETQEPQLIVDETAKSHISEMAGWGKFLAISSFIGMGLLIIAGVFMGSVMGKLAGNNGIPALGGIGMGLIYAVIAALYFYPTYALYKFSRLSKTAVATNNRETLNVALGYLKNAFKYMGIVMIIVLGIYALAIIIAIIAGVAFSGLHR